MENTDLPKCHVAGCDNRVDVISTNGWMRCNRCNDELTGTPLTVWEAIKPRESLRKKLKNLLDNGKLRG